MTGKPWLDADAGRPLIVRGAAGVMAVAADATHVPWETIARVTGIPLVDLSIEHEDNIVRGEN